jgi:steroid-24-oyl-CoA synthetase
MNNLWLAFTQSCDQWPGRVAIVKGGTSITFGEWYQRSRKLASWLREQNVCPGDRLLLAMSNEQEMAIALTATWGAGAIPVIMDSQSMEPQFEAAIALTSPAMLISFGEAPKLDNPVPRLDLLQVAEATEIEDRGAHSSALSTDVASIIFTSGSTGGPKGVAQSHENLLDGCNAVDSYQQLGGSDRIVFFVLFPGRSTTVLANY